MGTREEIRERLSLAEVIGDYVKLTPVGKGRFKGLCPFHNEKTPSFQVDNEQGYYYCFGCKASGDLFKFVEETEHLSFSDALRKLAERAGVTVETRYGEKSSRDIYEVNAFALHYFRANLDGVGRDYLLSRGLSEETIDRFELGYAPEGWDGLLKLARTRGVDERQLMEAGLLTENTQTGRVYDRFRGRVMFPIRDHLGRLVGFGGRVLGDEKPKYLNTPETPAFKKGELLYGLNLARQQVQSGQELIVVEGYMDVIALHQAGFDTAVATLGTALTADHAQLLARLDIRRLTLMFDRDEAGLRATLAGLDQMVGSTLRVRATRVPSGKDPADAVMSGELHALRQALSSGLNEVYYRVQAAIERHTLSAEGKKRILQELLPRMQNLDPLDETASEMRRLVSEPLGLKQQALEEWIASKAKRKSMNDTLLAGMQSTHEDDHELALLRQILLAPRLLSKLDGHTPWQNQTVKKVMLAAQGAKSSEEILALFRGQPEEALLVRLLFEGREGRALSRATNEQFEQKVQSYAESAVDDIQVGLSIDSMRSEVDLLKKQIATAEATEKMQMLRQISELQRAIEAEKRARKMQA